MMGIATCSFYQYLACIKNKTLKVAQEDLGSFCGNLDCSWGWGGYHGRGKSPVFPLVVHTWEAL